MIKRKNWYKKLIVGLLLATALVSGIATLKPFAEVATPRYTLSEESVVRNEQVASKGRILIIHTHTQEDYTDSNVVEMGQDLADKLNKKGYIAENITLDFVRGDYNNAYNYSREYLQSIDLTKYDLVIDYHRDALSYSNTVIHNGNEVAKGMFVFSKNSKHFSDSEYHSNKILGYMDNFNRGLTRDSWYYDYGINDFNSDLGDNIVLWESGNNSNNKLEIMRLNTYFASAIDQYLSNK